MKKTFSSIIILLVIVTLGLGNQAVASENEWRECTSSSVVDYDHFTKENTLLLSFFQRKLNANSETPHYLADIKVLGDFCNNEYYLFEYEPFGYLIYSIEFGIILEYSSECVSPYQGKEGTLLYFGPKEYYFYDNGVLSNTITKAIIGEEVIPEYRMISEKIDKELKIYNENEKNRYLLNEDAISTSNSSFNKSSTTSNTYVVFSSYISELRSAYEIGYFEDEISDGYCGYIAANMLMFYYDRVVDSDFVDTQYIEWHYSSELGKSIWCLKGSDLTEHLISLSGSTGGTTAYSIAAVIEDYCLEQGVSIYSYTLILPTKNYIKGRIDDDNPVILFGNLTNPTKGNVNHAVLVYGYTSDDDLICHYGWENYYNVVVGGIWGSIYTLNCL